MSGLPLFLFGCWKCSRVIPEDGNYIRIEAYVSPRVALPFYFCDKDRCNTEAKLYMANTPNLFTFCKIEKDDDTNIF